MSPCTVVGQLRLFAIVLFVSSVGYTDAFSGRSSHSSFSIDESDGSLETSELILKYGYPLERYEVITDDGYILSLLRIQPRNETTNSGAIPPVLLVHGLFASSADFVLIGPNNSLAYLLADRGYEVWLVDLRGNRYSQRHTHLSQESADYWDFSWHEMGYYDLPATIDRILELTRFSRLHYIGYSQGTTVFFVMVSMRPEYNAKITRMYALSPAVYVQHIRSPIFRWLAKHGPTVKMLLDGLHRWQLFPHNAAMYRLQRTLCPVEDRRNLCVRLIEQLVGPNPQGTDPLAMHIIGGHNPSGASTKQLLHFSQLSRSNRFQRYDHGRPERNVERYGSLVPPAYNLTRATVPVVMFYGRNDWMIHPSNVLRLAQELPNLVSNSAVADANFNHLDFVLNKRVRSQVYEPLLKDLELAGKEMEESRTS